jgi:hypothetical protein
MTARSAAITAVDVLLSAAPTDGVALDAKLLRMCAAPVPTRSAAGRADTDVTDRPLLRLLGALVER